MPHEQMSSHLDEYRRRESCNCCWINTNGLAVGIHPNRNFRRNFASNGLPGLRML